MPDTLEGIRHVGRLRQDRVNYVRQFLGTKLGPPGFWPPEEPLIPYAIPYFGSQRKNILENITEVLGKLGVMTGIYHMDVNRDCYNPDYRPCVLLPCHQEIPQDLLAATCRTIDRLDR